jgi:geranylgeranylglycerol-phosphate geranylgeranyltransferase
MQQALLLRPEKQENKTEKRRSLGTLALSQFVLLNSRKKWGIMYMLATISGIFMPLIGIYPTVVDHGATSFILITLPRTIPLAAASFLIITGMYILNDLVDADLDKSNGKKRPIPSGQVTKSQALLFVILSNSIGLLLTLFTFNISSVILASVIVGIGLLYSAPKISLKDRFVLKTLSIAAASMLCLLMGSSYALNVFHVDQHLTTVYSYNVTYNSLLVSCVYAASMSGSIIFITSLLNDLGDVEGDKAFGRKTIPVKLGKKNAVIMTIVIAASMIIISWTLYYWLPKGVGIVSPILVSTVATVAIARMAGILPHLTDSEFIRKQHKKSILWHLMLQGSLIVGAMLIWI